MMERILADTNALGYLQQNHPTVVALLDGKQVFISELTEIELLCNPNLSKEERNLTQKLLDDCYIIPLNEQIKKIAIRIRLSTRMKLIDAIVTATGVWLDIPILTHDNGFERAKNVATIILFEKEVK
ncbi:hypothetical protein BN8_02815 [Fibrisoma limi BUZ 3]|uniref:PIN domain-containing protein n=1 Tax=Fibrisoma limi BUZ 3 TaxID=1185876 RepID=I2GIH5_9BACT|nr:PIN domain-containing protein [Fibrisoma limi]CCH53700.1 hypothetical protein BN8_02815 [Fibrisoma limi BUZ 3]